MTEFFNRRAEKDKRRALRRALTPAETRLWSLLRSRRTGPKWRRQYSAGVYILDFYCPALRLAAELDGPSHDGAEAQAYDAERTAYLASLGIRVLRFANRAVFAAPAAVLEAIKAASS